MKEDSQKFNFLWAKLRQFLLVFLCGLEPQTTKSIYQSCQCKATISLFTLNQFAEGYFQTQSSRGINKLRKYSKQKQKLGNNWFAFLELLRRLSSRKLKNIDKDFRVATHAIFFIELPIPLVARRSIKLLLLPTTHDKNNIGQSSLYNESAESMEIELMCSRLRRRNIPADAMSSEVEEWFLA